MNHHKLLLMAILCAGMALAAVPAHAGVQFDSATGYPLDEGLPEAPGQSTAYEASHVICSGPCYLDNLTVNFHTAAFRTLMLFNATSVPANGTVQPAWCIEGISQSTSPAESFQSLTFTKSPLYFNVGLTAVLSTSTSGCASLTADGANDWFNWGVTQTPR